MIECNLHEIKKRSFFSSASNKIKYGVYSSAIYHNIKGFGKKAWVVIVNINLDYEKHADKGKSLEEITKGCIEYLNTAPKSKYGRRRKRKLLYGSFRGTPYRAYLKEKNNKKYIQALLIVEDKKRKCFWGQGEKLRLRK
tara:strand:- start:178 stop:594 length:417 start_codon:yes stop_codon:yes gene_type:complete